MNKVILMGRSTRDPEVRYSQGANQTAVARFSIAVDRRFKREGEPDADFFNCTAFGKTGEVVEKHCTKGTKLIITGEWTTGSYKNKDGNTVYTNDCNVSKLEFSESKNASQGGNTQDAPKPMPADSGFMDIPTSGIGNDLPFK